MITPWNFYTSRQITRVFACFFFWSFVDFEVIRTDVDHFRRGHIMHPSTLVKIAENSE